MYGQSVGLNSEHKDRDSDIIFILRHRRVSFTLMSSEHISTRVNSARLPNFVGQIVRLTCKPLQVKASTSNWNRLTLHRKVQISSPLKLAMGDR